jgi:hypothetical protein
MNIWDATFKEKAAGGRADAIGLRAGRVATIDKPSSRARRKRHEPTRDHGLVRRIGRADVEDMIALLHVGRKQRYMIC